MWWDVIVTALGDASFRRYLVISRDMTERKLMEDSLLLAREAAESANKSKSEFLANMSHEIRTPLNGVLGMLQLLEGSSLAPEQREYLLAAIRSTDRLNRLLSDILDISRMEAGKLQIIDVEFGVERLKESIVELFRRTAKDKGISLAFALDPAMPPALVGDETRLRQILFNLVGNAIKFTSTGHVRVDAVTLPHAADSQVRALFTVRDTGIGITDGQLKEIFEPFVQAEGSYTRRFQGAGLGLSIVRKLTALMSGDLAIDNSPGGGTTVYLSLPLALPQGHEERIAPQAQAAFATVGSALRILFVEDDEASLLSGKRILEKSGYAVTTALDGQEALTLLAERDFDLILMDIQLPVMDGMEATRIIRGGATLGPVKARIPIIAITAYAMTGDRETFLAAGMDDYIAKPVDRQSLLEMIRKVMARRSN